MDIKGSVALVTGANRGIGAEWVRQLRERGAAKIYAGARDPLSVSPADGVVPIALNVTDKAQVEAAASQAADVNIIINNAAVSYRQPLIGADLDKIHDEFETNVFGPVYVAEAFAPVLEANGGGAIVNALSAVSWFSFPGMAATALPSPRHGISPTHSALNSPIRAPSWSACTPARWPPLWAITSLSTRSIPIRS
jgi:NAD(P)-dependent dehydrogenase (short-subunit alcohol dehydrogenase family)